MVSPKKFQEIEKSTSLQTQQKLRSTWTTEKDRHTKADSTEIDNSNLVVSMEIPRGGFRSNKINGYNSPLTNSTRSSVLRTNKIHNKKDFSS